MQLPVIIEPLTPGGFRAKAGEPLPLVAEGATREEALAKLREKLNGRIRSGAQLVAIDLPTQDNPWLAMAGIHDPSDPLVQEWKKEVAAYRQELDNDPDAL